SKINIILQIGDQSIEKMMKLTVALRRQHAIMNKCVETLNLGGKGLKKSKRTSNDGFIIPNHEETLDVDDPFTLSADLTLSTECGNGNAGSRRILVCTAIGQVGSDNPTRDLSVTEDPPLLQLSQEDLSITRSQNIAWFLRPKFENDLIYNEKGQLKGGTLDALIERLTGHDMMDSAFNKAFLLTFESFTSAYVLFYKLIGRYFDRT